ncbi:MAG: S8 family peptidase [Pseudomonadota bacterium]
MRIRVLAFTALLASTGLTACDQREERLNRAGDLSRAVLDQVTGADTPNDPKEAMRKAPQEARAFQGQMQPTFLPDLPDASQRRFVIGSIVAKPRDLPPPVAMAEIMATPELAMDVVVDEEAESRIVVLDEATMEAAVDQPAIIERIERPEALKRSKVTVVDPRIAPAPKPVIAPGPTLPRAPLRERLRRGEPAPLGNEVVLPEPIILEPAPVMIETPKERMEKLPQLKPQVAQRALTMRQTALTKQLQAEDRMIETAQKYKLAASIQRSRSGQMVIEIGADAMSPTQFTGNTGKRQIFAIENEATICDADAVQEGRASAEVAMTCVIEELEASGEFEYVEKDYLFEHQMISRPDTETAQIVIPNDPLFGLQWHYQNAADIPGGAGFVDFWTREETQGTPDVAVAVIDTGLDFSHPDFQYSMNLANGWDMVTDPDVGNDGDGRDGDPTDPGDICPEKGRFENSWHGTHVAGTLGAGLTDNARGVAGAVWDVKIVPVRALGKCGGRLSDINDAIRWAAGTIPEYDELGNEVWNDNPADIINLSFGLFKTCPASMQDAINAVTAEGVTVVAAAGNNRIPTQFFAPASCQNVITVASGDARGYLAPYSNYGSAVDLIAPGGDLSRDDNGDGNPDGVLSTKVSENCFDPVDGSPVATCYYSYEEGTSMAAPHVSAALALIKAKRPELTRLELFDTLMVGVTPSTEAQCSGDCINYPGAEPSDADPDICLRPCGAGLLNLSAVDLSEE